MSIQQNRESYPVIVIEGLDGVGKSTLTRKLTEAIGGVLLGTPPVFELEVLGFARKHFDDQPAVVRRAFYRFGNVVVSEQARALRVDRPVVIDRYWPSTVAFAVGNGESVEVTQWLGRYPDELLKPDLLILLTADERARLARHQGRGTDATMEEQRLERQKPIREKIVEVYLTFEPVVVDTSELNPEAVLEAVLGKLPKRV